VKANIKGQRFGKLLAIEETSGRDDSGSIIWKMKCDCGNEHYISVRGLRYRQTKSCGRCTSVKYRTIGKITRGIYSDGTYFLFDTEDLDRVKKHYWSRSGNGYIHSSINGKYTCLHRFILREAKQPDLLIDHINRNRWDNRKENLRLIDTVGNSLNKTIDKTGRTSIYRGVCWDKARNKWRAEIAVGRKYNLGRFSSEEEAAMAYNHAVYLLASEFVDYNDVPEAPRWIKDSVYEKCSRHFDKAAVSILEDKSKEIPGVEGAFLVCNKDKIPCKEALLNA